MQEIIEIKLWQMIAAYLFILMLMAIFRVKAIPREREITVATFRMTVQLVLTGYVLGFLFDNPHPLLSLAALTAMLIFAVQNITRRVRVKVSQPLRRSIALSMVAGTLVSLLYFVVVVVGLVPWYEPRYFITLAGMLIGNSMTGVALGVGQLAEGMNADRRFVETALMLGATPRAASKPIINRSLEAGVLPTINSMVGMGIVFLPGMMTGQILAGVSAVTAIQYQIAIMLGIAGSVALSVFAFVELGYKTFFNSEQQLELPQ